MGSMLMDIDLNQPAGGSDCNDFACHQDVASDGVNFTFGEEPGQVGSVGSGSANQVGGSTNDVTDITDGNDEISSQPAEPYVGLEYFSKDEARVYYNKYAKKWGFCTKVSSNSRSHVTKEFNQFEFACSYERTTKEDELASSSVSGKHRTNKKVRTNCKARIVIVLREGRWEVTISDLEHNHPPARKQDVRYMTSHRNIGEEDYALIELLHTNNVPTRRVMSVLSDIHGGIREIPFTTTDVTNLRASFRKEGGSYDMAETMKHFEELKAEDPAFFCSMQLVDGDRVGSLFWADGAAREAYKRFSECVIFDTTYCTNKYKLPFAPITGVTNHAQSVLFGCAFLKDEMLETFEWLFKSFLTAMDNKAPKSIMTDQDIAMEFAIGNVMPSTVHRQCMWHAFRNIKLKLGPLFAKLPGLEDKLRTCIEESLTPDEFEATWAELLACYDLSEHKYLKRIYDNRKKWVPCYFRDAFFPCMDTTLRSEGMNALFKDYVHQNDSIVNFVRQY